MNSDLAIFAARLRDFIGFCGDDSRAALPPADLRQHSDAEFNALALVLFGLQFRHNAAYRKIAQARGTHPDAFTHWTQIPAVPTAAFKELELTSLAPGDRTAVFHSSGTTEQKPSRHFHCADSLATYEASLWPWFAQQFQFPISNFQLAILTPPPALAPHSSLVHMFATIRSRACESAEHAFLGQVAPDGAWTLDFAATLRALNSKLETNLPRRPVAPESDEGGSAAKAENPKLLLGTAFSFVHLLDYLAEKNLRLALPPGSCILETGGYKNRSRSLPKAELYALITDRLGVAPENICCEYGMSELNSQAYDSEIHPPSSIPVAPKQSEGGLHPRIFRFPPWARAQIISPETGREVAEGETGLIRVCDLANVYSVMAVQTEDLAVRRGDGFELIGRATAAEPRGCSLMTA